MAITKVAWTVVLVGSSVIGACVSDEPPGPSQAAVAAKPEIGSVPEPTPEPTPSPMPDAAPKLDVGSLPSPEPSAVPEPSPEPQPATELAPPAHARLVKPKPGATPWVERPGLSEIHAFHPFVIGVLAECGPDGGRWCELGADGRLVPSKVGHPDDEDGIVGSWPSDAWRVRTEEGDGDLPHEAWVSVELLRWNGRRFAREPRIKLDIDPMAEQAGVPRVVVGKHWAGGMLLYDGGVVRRIPAPTTPGVKVSHDVHGVLGTAAGGLLLWTYEGDNQMAMQPPCAAASCKAQAFALPRVSTSDPSARWSLQLGVPRGGDAMTMVVEQDGDPYLLHYDAPMGEPAGEGGGEGGTWVLEALPILRVDASMLWPDGRGGVWLEADPMLWYRDAGGEWFEVAPPPGEPLGYANRAQPRELLALVRRKGETYGVFATAGPVVAQDDGG